AVIPNGNLDPAEVPEGQWASWDPAMDRDWEDFFDNLQTARLKDDQIPELSKPSGPRVASLYYLWHYPTYRTDRDLVRTHATYPIRIKYTAGEPNYKELLGDKAEPRIKAVCEDFALEAVKLVPFTIALGKHNSGLVRRKLEETDGLYLETYTIKSAIKMSDRATSCMDVQDIDEIIVNMDNYRLENAWVLIDLISEQLEKDQFQIDLMSEP
ncbi:hypothetical protein N5P37_000089, partial [Trichoderma harzianum]